MAYNGHRIPKSGNNKSARRASAFLLFGFCIFLHAIRHSSFETTHRLYLAVSSDLVDKDRQVNAENLANFWLESSFVGKKV